MKNKNLLKIDKQFDPQGDEIKPNFVKHYFTQEQNNFDLQGKDKRTILILL